MPSNDQLELTGYGMRAAHMKATEPFRVDVTVTRADGTTEQVDTDS
jgi:hypothetical protein